jgi:Zn-dependent protease with chaperone function
MGYGRNLAFALRRVISLGGGQRPVGWRARLAASHPPARTRVARIDAMLRHPAH